MHANVSLQTRTIRMQPGRVSVDANDRKFVEQEQYLRRQAYRNTTIKIDETFFDDSDMRSEYFLTLVFDSISEKPLLSSRYYFDKLLIENFLKGDDNVYSDLIYRGKRFELNDQTFLADRLSGNIKDPLYRVLRGQIFSLYYREIVRNNENCDLLLMVRKEKGDKQLRKYFELGFNLLGSTTHKGKEHSIILGELSTWQGLSLK